MCGWVSRQPCVCQLLGLVHCLLPAACRCRCRGPACHLHAGTNDPEAAFKRVACCHAANALQTAFLCCWTSCQTGMDGRGFEHPKYAHTHTSCIHADHAARAAPFCLQLRQQAGGAGARGSPHLLLCEPHPWSVLLQCWSLCARSTPLWPACLARPLASEPPPPLSLPHRTPFQLCLARSHAARRPGGLRSLHPCQPAPRRQPAKLVPAAGQVRAS